MTTDMRSLKNHHLGLNTSADVEPPELDISEYANTKSSSMPFVGMTNIMISLQQLRQIWMNHLRNPFQKEATRMPED